MSILSITNDRFNTMMTGGLHHECRLNTEWSVYCFNILVGFAAHKCASFSAPPFWYFVIKLILYLRRWDMSKLHWLRHASRLFDDFPASRCIWYSWDILEIPIVESISLILLTDIKLHLVLFCLLFGSRRLNLRDGIYSSHLPEEGAGAIILHGFTEI